LSIVVDIREDKFLTITISKGLFSKSITFEIVMVRNLSSLISTTILN